MHLEEAAKLKTAFKLSLGISFGTRFYFSLRAYALLLRRKLLREPQLREVKRYCL